jgi:hypothetical protein
MKIPTLVACLAGGIPAAIGMAVGLALPSCKSKPDPAALFPISTESPDYQNGFRAGFYEGLTYNQITP